MTTYSTGTISVAANGTAVTGVGTAWTTAGLQPGDRLLAGTGVGLIASINSATSITLKRPWHGGALSASVYDIEYVPDGARALAALNQVSQKMGQGGLPPLAPLTPAADKFAYYTGANTAAMADLTPFARTLLDDPNRDDMRATLGLVPTTSLQDATVGRLARVGDFGMGFTSRIDAVNLDEETFPPGFYGGAAWINTPIGTLNDTTWTNVHIETLASAPSNYRRQTVWIGTAANQHQDTYQRTKRAGIWGEWRRLFSSHNVIGAVSQSGGTPTGALIEKGSNANGRYARFADGTLICTHTVDATDASWSTAAGALYKGQNTLWSFPTPFIFTPTVMGHGSRSADAEVRGVVVRNAASNACNVVPWVTAPIAAGEAKTIGLIAIGQWY